MMLVREMDIVVGGRYLAYFTNLDNKVWNEWIPIEIIKEYKYFYTVRVPPHQRREGLGMSRPYPLTLDKFDLRTGAVKLRCER